MLNVQQGASIIFMQGRSLRDKSVNPSKNSFAPVAWFGLLRCFIAFAGVGVVGTLAHYLTLLLLVEWQSSGTTIGTAVGFVIGAAVNYSLNYKFTFRSETYHRVALPKFLTVASVGFYINAIIMKVGVTRLAVHYLLVQLFATGVVLIWNFTGNMLWTFRESHRGQ